MRDFLLVWNLIKNVKDEVGIYKMSAIFIKIKTNKFEKMPNTKKVFGSSFFNHSIKRYFHNKIR